MALAYCDILDGERDDQQLQIEGGHSTTKHHRKLVRINRRDHSMEPEYEDDFSSYHSNHQIMRLSEPRHVKAQDARRTHRIVRYPIDPKYLEQEHLSERYRPTRTAHDRPCERYHSRRHADEEAIMPDDSASRVGHRRETHHDFDNRDSASRRHRNNFMEYREMTLSPRELDRSSRRGARDDGERCEHLSGRHRCHDEYSPTRWDIITVERDGQLLEVRKAPKTIPY